MSDHTWEVDAACAGMDTEWFFPPVGGRQAVNAKAVCAVCPVVAQCLASVLHISKDDDHGIFGNTSRNERRAIRAKGAA